MGDGIERRELLDGDGLSHTIRRIASEILDRHGTRPLAFVGIHTRGVVFAERVAAIVEERHAALLRGTIDITLYRDDLDNLGAMPSVKSSDLPFDIEGTSIVLFDDVLFTGRTIRAALNVLMDYGRPARIELAVLVDRGNRELPIGPDYVGRAIKTGKNEHISVRFRETDDADGVSLLRREEPR
jgi:pyrimidine operon attenuation protein / uracil phosphoribosyltransferase